MYTSATEQIELLQIIIVQSPWGGYSAETGYSVYLNELFNTDLLLFSAKLLDCILNFP